MRTCSANIAVLSYSIMTAWPLWVASCFIILGLLWPGVLPGPVIIRIS